VHSVLMCVMKQGVGLDARDILVIVLMNDMIDMLKKFANSGETNT
jgi:hypothetical protein